MRYKQAGRDFARGSHWGRPLTFILTCPIGPEAHGRSTTRNPQARLPGARLALVGAPSRAGQSDTRVLTEAGALGRCVYEEARWQRTEHRQTAAAPAACRVRVIN